MKSAHDAQMAMSLSIQRNRASAHKTGVGMVAVAAPILIFSFVTGNPVGAYWGVLSLANCIGLILIDYNKSRMDRDQQFITRNKPIPLAVKRFRKKLGLS